MVSIKGKNVEPGHYVTAHTNSKAVFLTVGTTPDLHNQVYASGFYQEDLSRAEAYDGYYSGNDLYVYDTTDYPCLPKPPKI